MLFIYTSPMLLLIEEQLYKTYIDILNKVEILGPKIIGALLIVIV